MYNSSRLHASKILIGSHVPRPVRALESTPSTASGRDSCLQKSKTKDAGNPQARKRQVARRHNIPLLPPPQLSGLSAPSSGKAATLPSLRRARAPAFPLRQVRNMLFIPLAAARRGRPSAHGELDSSGMKDSILGWKRVLAGGERLDEHPAPRYNFPFAARPDSVILLIWRMHARMRLTGSIIPSTGFSTCTRSTRAK